jgi:hypothetical protein
MQGVPYTFDLLETSDMGAQWLDVLRSTGSDLVTRPRLPSPSSRPQEAVAGFDGWVPQSALSPAPGALWLTSYNEDFGGISFASTGDAGLQWSQNAYPGQRPGTKSPLPQSGWTSTAASGPATAWAIFTGQRNKAGVEDSALYATNDARAHWRLAKVFSWPPAEG